MNIDITPIKYKHGEVVIDEIYSFDKSDLEKTDMLDLHDVHVNGVIRSNMAGGYQLSLTISGEMVLACAVTLKPVTYPFSIDIDGDAHELQQEIDENYEKMENSIDILPIIWENILMEIPLRVVSEEAKNAEMQGDGWKLITERESVSETNPELEKLKDLL